MCELNVEVSVWQIEGVMAAVDCTDATAVCTNNDVTGYPTCKSILTSSSGKSGLPL